MSMKRIAIGICAAALLVSASSANAEDAARGKITFMQQCAMCHTILSGQHDSMGPNLFGVVGRKAGTKPGYSFSDAMKNSGITWTTDSLKTFVLNPSGTVRQRK